MDTRAESASYSVPKPSLEVRRRRSRIEPALPFLLPLATLVAIVFLWDGAITLFRVPPEVLPRPFEAIDVLWHGLVTGVFIFHMLVTLQEVVYGFAIGCTAGFVAGVLVAEFRYVRMAVFPFLIVLQITPKVAIAPLFIIWLGYGIESKVAIAASISFFPVVINTVAGLRAADSEILEMMKAFCATRWQTFHRVKLKLAMPYIFAGLNVAMALAVIGAIVAEFVGSTKGLGYLILQANFRLDMAQVFAVLVMLAALGITLNTALQLLARRALFWHDSVRST
jgi:NitT/TauT family transport system permease protein